MTGNEPAPGTAVCRLADLRDGGGHVVTWGQGKTAFGVVLLRSGDEVTAYVNACPHFHIPLDHRSTVTTFREFVLCSHHYAAFRASDGYCVEGPCEGASLTPVPITIEDDCVRIA